MPIQPLNPEQLRRVCDPLQFNFETTAELEPVDTIVGQPRGVRAIEFGIGIQSQGYNVYVMGDIDTGSMSAIERFLQTRAATQSVPNDWVYVHNFAVPHQPRAVSLSAGRGRRLKTDMEELVSALKKELPDAFDTDAYRDAAENIRALYQTERDRLLTDLRQEASVDEMTVINTPSGFVIVPMVEGKAMSADDYNQLPVDEHQELEQKRQSWNDDLDDILRKMRELDNEAREQIDLLDREVAASSIKHHFDALRDRYSSHETVKSYIDACYEDVLDNLQDFLPLEADEEREIDLRRYEVNLLVDNGIVDTKPTGAPVVVELDPRYTNLLGRIEYEMQYGATSTHFTNIKAGSLHRANGGYLILNVRDLLTHSDSWEALKRAIKSREIRVQSPDRSEGTQVLAKSLDPEPIPLQVKIILLGNADYYFALYNREEEFGQLFKVKAEFDSVMPRDEVNELSYATFVASRCREENLRDFDRTAVAKIVEFGSRLCGHQNKLSTRLEIVADVIREANFWASHNRRAIVTGDDVKLALSERRIRSNLEEEQILEFINEGSLIITTEGTRVGQVNGLSVIDLGDYSYGQPGRITARTYRGERGIVNIDREVDLTGPIHHKGLLALTGYLGGTYAQENSMSISASITFEQNYSSIEGDSASSAELYTVLSSVGQIPLKQGIAVTGAVNQNGEILPIGGAIEKIEGFFNVCKSRGLTGEYGVIIPRANLPHLMLEDEVIEAVKDGRFHIWCIDTIEEGMEILSGLNAGTADEEGEFPEGTIHGAVQEGLRRLSKDEDDEDDEDEDEDEEEVEVDESEASSSAGPTASQ